MRQSTLMLTMLGAWVLAIIYDRIRINTGAELNLLLYTSITTLIVGLYLFCRKPKETDEGEA